MKCPKCESYNRERVNFCEECGAKFKLVCLSCKAQITVGKKFSRECDQNLILPSEHAPQEFSFYQKYERFKNTFLKGLTDKILYQSDRIEGERRKVTVMFCNMETFTQLSEFLDIEEAYANMDQVCEILIHKAHNFEGIVWRSFPVY